jgi:hypothetical protein
VTTTNSSRIATRARAIVGIGILSVAMVAGTAGVAQAASVPAQPINSGNPTCGDFVPAGQAWTQFKLDAGNLGNGTYSDGILIVTISNYVNSNSGTPGSFDWSSNIGVDAVFVKAGTDKHNLFVYDPESTGDTDLGPQAGQGNGISHISFCYDNDPQTPSAPPSSAPSAPPSSAPSDKPSTPPSSVASAAPSSEAPSESPFGEVLGLEGAPAVTLPPTDTLVASTDDFSTGPVLIVIGSLLGLAVLLTVRRPARTRR